MSRLPNRTCSPFWTRARDVERASHVTKMTIKGIMWHVTHFSLYLLQVFWRITTSFEMLLRVSTHPFHVNVNQMWCNIWLDEFFVGKNVLSRIFVLKEAEIKLDYSRREPLFCDLFHFVFRNLCIWLGNTRHFFEHIGLLIHTYLSQCLTNQRSKPF